MLFAGEKVEEGVKVAFDMAQAGVEALNPGIAMKDFSLDIDPPRAEPLNNLIKNVFAHPNIIDDKMPEQKKQSRFNYRMNLQNLKLLKVHRTYLLLYSSLSNRPSY